MCFPSAGAGVPHIPAVTTLPAIFPSMFGYLRLVLITLKMHSLIVLLIVDYKRRIEEAQVNLISPADLLSSAPRHSHTRLLSGSVFE